MNNAWQGFVAIIIFLFLLLFFLATVATPNVAAGVQSNANSGVILVVTPTPVSVFDVSAVSPQSAGAPNSVNAAQPLVIPPTQAGTSVYIVQPGDWLSNIARQHNTSVPALLAANPQIADPDRIQPGEVIVIP